jgi:hypothetical protein
MNPYRTAPPEVIIKTPWYQFILCLINRHDWFYTYHKRHRFNQTITTKTCIHCNKIEIDDPNIVKGWQ